MARWRKRARLRARGLRLRARRVAARGLRPLGPRRAAHRHAGVQGPGQDRLSRSSCGTSSPRARTRRSRARRSRATTSPTASGPSSRSGSRRRPSSARLRVDEDPHRVPRSPRDLVGSARTWSKSANEEQGKTLAGLHGDYMLFVLDETGGMPEAIMVAAEAALASGIECRIVQAGNPIQCEGPLWVAANRDRRLWKVVEITGDPDDPRRSPRIDPKWAREQIKSHGRDNPWVMANVLGQVPLEPRRSRSSRAPGRRGDEARGRGADHRPAPDRRRRRALRRRQDRDPLPQGPRRAHAPAGQAAQPGQHAGRRARGAARRTSRPTASSSTAAATAAA
jgi:hypothetical protein